MPSYNNQFRIIAGRWRRRRLRFPADGGVRPSPDRVRETLFNWLMPVIAGARCLDLFAGSGALGLEALSRGAAEAVFVEREPRLAAAIESHLRVLDAAGGRVVVADALAWLAAPASTFDIVMLDPPFASGLLAPACERLQACGWLHTGTRIYGISSRRHTADTDELANHAHLSCRPGGLYIISCTRRDAKRGTIVPS
jgi:16S rRNA (guanine966-N2)-methyltransferase